VSASIVFALGHELLSKDFGVVKVRNANPFWHFEHKSQLPYNNSVSRRLKSKLLTGQSSLYKWAPHHAEGLFNPNPMK
jgi:hypothetical protein